MRVTECTSRSRLPTSPAAINVRPFKLHIASILLMKPVITYAKDSNNRTATNLPNASSMDTMYECSHAPGIRVTVWGTDTYRLPLTWTLMVIR